MPFLEDEGPIDAAVRSGSAPIMSLAGFVPSDSERRLNFANKSLCRYLGNGYSTTAGTLDALLDPEQTSVEGRVVWLPRAGEVRLAVIHTRPRSAPWTFTRGARAGGIHARGLPNKIPRPAGSGRHPAQRSGRAVTVDPGHEEDIGLIHEVAHMYWRSPKMAVKGARNC